MHTRNKPTSRKASASHRNSLKTSQRHSGLVPRKSVHCRFSFPLTRDPSVKEAARLRATLLRVRRELQLCRDDLQTKKHSRVVVDQAVKTLHRQVLALTKELRPGKCLSRPKTPFTTSRKSEVQSPSKAVQCQPELCSQHGGAGVFANAPSLAVVPLERSPTVR